MPHDSRVRDGDYTPSGLFPDWRRYSSTPMEIQRLLFAFEHTIWRSNNQVYVPKRKLLNYQRCEWLSTCTAKRGFIRYKRAHGADSP